MQRHNTIRYSQKCLKLDLAETVRLYFDEHLTLAEVGERVGAAGNHRIKRLVAAGYEIRNRGEVEASSKITEFQVHGCRPAEMERLYCQAEWSSAEIGIGMSAVI